MMWPGFQIAGYRGKGVYGYCTYIDDLSREITGIILRGGSVGESDLKINSDIIFVHLLLVMQVAKT
jgi:hypothetical protein